MPVSENLSIREIALEIYGGCNYKCEMCPQAWGREHNFLNTLPFDVFTKIVDEGKQYGVDLVSLQGSGEPTLNPKMPQYVRYVKEQGIKCISLTNGYLLTPKLSRELIESGIDTLRVSAIGYDRETYHRWMSKDAFDLVRDNVRAFVEIREELEGKTELTLYHLITDIDRQDYEVEMYRKNWIDYCRAPGEIWMMHNWAGSYTDLPYERQRRQRRSCGRPHAPYLTVRAGGLNGHRGAVVACCFVLGQDSIAVLGHLDTQSIAEVVSGDKYNFLRLKHEREEFDDIPYCKNCDQLYDVPESLAWTNIPGKKYGQAKMTQNLDFRQWAV